MGWFGDQVPNNVLSNVRALKPSVMATLMSIIVLWAGVVAAASAEINDEPPTSSEQRLDQWIAGINDHWSTQLRSHTSGSIRAFRIPLGAMKKTAGIWRLESSEAITGSRRRLTWQVEGEPVLELFNTLAETMGESAALQWQCDGRACGNAAEWANKVYQERLLYGRDEFMAYRAFRLDDGVWLTLFSAARTADRQYLHVDIVKPLPAGG
jgi:hypothetical protein